jgi:hypothetical protein
VADIEPSEQSGIETQSLAFSRANGQLPGLQGDLLNRRHFIRSSGFAQRRDEVGVDERTEGRGQQQRPEASQQRIGTVASRREGVMGDRARDCHRAQPMHQPPGLVAVWQLVAVNRHEHKGRQGNPGDQPRGEGAHIETEGQLPGNIPRQWRVERRAIQEGVHQNEHQRRARKQLMQPHGDIHTHASRSHPEAAGKHELHQQNSEGHHGQPGSNFVLYRPWRQGLQVPEDKRGNRDDQIDREKQERVHRFP